METEKWAGFLGNYEGASGEAVLELRPSMDTEEALGGSEVLGFFNGREPDPNTRKALSEAFSGLSFLQRNVLRGIYDDGMGLKGIAKKLGKKEAAVRQLKSRALRKLKNVLSAKKVDVTFVSGKNPTDSGC